MGFKSKVTPCLDVVRFDGQRCLGFVEKKARKIHIIHKGKRKRKVNFSCLKEETCCVWNSRLGRS